MEFHKVRDQEDDNLPVPMDEQQKNAVRIAAIQHGMDAAQSLLIEREDYKRRLEEEQRENHRLQVTCDGQARELADLRTRCEDLRIINRSLHGDNERLRAFAQLVRGATEKILEIDTYTPRPQEEAA